jgi:hypothetical protein
LDDQKKNIFGCILVTQPIKTKFGEELKEKIGQYEQLMSMIQIKVKYILMQDCLEKVTLDESRRIMDELSENKIDLLKSLYPRVDVDISKYLSLPNDTKVAVLKLDQAQTALAEQVEVTIRDSSPGGRNGVLGRVRQGREEKANLPGQRAADRRLLDFLRVFREGQAALPRSDLRIFWLVLLQR